jgi:hypothetical protein
LAEWKNAKLGQLQLQKGSAPRPLDSHASGSPGAQRYPGHDLHRHASEPRRFDHQHPEYRQQFIQHDDGDRN